MHYLKKADEVLARAKPVQGLPEADSLYRGNARDPWRHVLADIENLPDVPGKVGRFYDEIRIASAFLLGDMLGLDKDRVQMGAVRLGKAMRRQGWSGPRPLRLGKKVFMGYAKTIKPTHFGQRS
jgi:hypothetical protein